VNVPDPIGSGVDAAGVGGRADHNKLESCSVLTSVILVMLLAQRGFSRHGP